MNKTELIDVYKDTLKIAETLPFSKPFTTKYYLSDIDKPKFLNEANIIVVPSDSVTTIFSEVKKSSRVCVLNMASYKTPGGGVARGSVAQEECLYRCSNMGSVYLDHLYPLEDTSALYSTGAAFFKDKNYNITEPVICDVITIAAFNFNSNGKIKPVHDTYEADTKDKIRLMLSLAINEGVETIILGSWGCGVFKNDPLLMAKMFKEVLVEEGYANNFKKVVFAVINDSNSVGNNYSIFNQILID